MNPIKRTFALAMVLVFLNGCAAGTLITTEPGKAEIWVNGKLATNRSPHRVKASRAIFASGSTDIMVRAEGFEERKLVAEQVMDGQCIGTTVAYSVGGALLLILPILGLFYLPWCSKFEEDYYFVELDPEQRTSPVAASPTIE